MPFDCSWPPGGWLSVCVAVTDVSLQMPVAHHARIPALRVSSHPCVHQPSRAKCILRSRHTDIIVYCIHRLACVQPCTRGWAQSFILRLVMQSPPTVAAFPCCSVLP